MLTEAQRRPTGQSDYPAVHWIAIGTWIKVRNLSGTI